MEGARSAIPKDLKFPPVQDEDVDAISEMAREIWEAIYPDIISHEQIEYMLAWMYSPDKIRSELNSGYAYHFMEWNSSRIGYLEFSKESDHIFLHKIYLKPEFHGKGVGSAALQWLIDLCEEKKCPAIRLRVNKANDAAKRAYERNGFQIIDSICEDIGGGYVMDDYIYQRAIDA